MDRGRSRKVAASDREREHALLENVVDRKAYERFKTPAYDFCDPVKKRLHEDNSFEAGIAVTLTD